MLRSVMPLTLVALALIGCTSTEAPETAERIAPVLEGMGDTHWPITTNSEEAQQFFDQALVLAYGFNHAESRRSFQQAALLDPECAMCFWGESLVLGPNINAPMDPGVNGDAWTALQKATELASGGTDLEQALIGALATRYAEEPPEDRSLMDVAYADAMREVYERFPDDDNVATLFAESLMDTTPWDYWREDGSPKPELEEVMAALEPVFERDSDHPGANHLWIHAVELGKPEDGVAAAERLANSAPGAGHLVHMPSHIYLRVGRYSEAAEANRLAIAADDSYVTQCHQQGLYPLAYMPHNRHFLWAAATLSGESEEALAAAQGVAASQDADLMREPGLGVLQHFWLTPLFAQVRFGRWDEILETLEPDEDLIYPRGVWHYARGMAMTRQGELDGAAAELAALAEISADPALEEITIFDINTSAGVLGVARELLAGELAVAQGDVDGGIERMLAAADIEDGLYYDEPATWHAPVRLYLGATYLENGRYEEAEEMYLANLEEYPDNGWALLGLRQALEAQGKNEAASEADARFQVVWKDADLTLAASRF